MSDLSGPGCGINLNANKPGVRANLCGQPAEYRVWTANCKGCEAMDVPECVGHPVCIEHGAALRTTAMEDFGEKAVLLRICTLEAAS